MLIFILRRVLQTIPSLLLMTLFVFIVLRVSGDPLMIMFGESLDLMTPEQVQSLRAHMGLDQPIFIQYVLYLRDLIQGDFGRSILYQNQAALPLVLQRLPATLELGAAALVVGILVSLPTGIIAALRRNRWPDHLASLFAILGQAMPNFWLGIMLILLVSVQFGWLPVSGRGGVQHVILPAIALGTSMAALLMRLMRSSLLEVLHADYVRTARAKGLHGTVVLIRHALRNAMIPYLTVLGLSIASLLSGSVVTEQVFAWPGMGLLLIRAIDGRDMAIVQTIVIFSALTVILGNLIVDLLYSVLDPRIRYE